MIVKLISNENNIIYLNFQREKGECANITLNACVMYDVNDNEKISFAYDLLRDKAYAYFNSIWETRNSPCDGNSYNDDTTSPDSECIVFEGFEYIKYEPQTQTIELLESEVQ